MTSRSFTHITPRARRVPIKYWIESIASYIFAGDALKLCLFATSGSRRPLAGHYLFQRPRLFPSRGATGGLRG